MTLCFKYVIVEDDAAALLTLLIHVLFSFLFRKKRHLKKEIQERRRKRKGRRRKSLPEKFAKVAQKMFLSVERHQLVSVERHQLVTRVTFIIGLSHLLRQPNWQIYCLRIVGMKIVLKEQVQEIISVHLVSRRQVSQNL